LNYKELKKQKKITPIQVSKATILLCLFKFELQLRSSIPSSKNAAPVSERVMTNQENI